MSTRWKITYTLKEKEGTKEGIEVEKQVAGYPDLGISLIYEGKNLTCVEHEVVIADGSTIDNVRQESIKRLKRFWEMLRYKRGLDIRIVNTSFEQLDPTPEVPGMHTGESKAVFGALLQRLITMPTQDKLTSPDERLDVWLHLANDAQPPSSDAHAIRNYYLIWEDLRNKLGEESVPREAHELKYIRDFVSHPKLHANGLIEFIEEELGRKISFIDQESGRRCVLFDPTDPDQQNLVRKHHEQAKKFIRNELDKLI